MKGSYDVMVESNQSVIPIQPGDIIYSTKSLSTFLVGHCGIVGHDKRIYHSHPKGAFADTLPKYIARHKFNGKIVIFRPRHSEEKLATWAEQNIQDIKSYFFHPKLVNKKSNYCSKFVWQAYWYCFGEDLTGRNLTDKKRTWIFPHVLKRASSLNNIGEWTIKEIKLGSEK